jgi:hypothetical protein
VWLVVGVVLARTQDQTKILLVFNTHTNVRLKLNLHLNDRQISLVIHWWFVNHLFKSSWIGSFPGINLFVFRQLTVFIMFFSQILTPLQVDAIQNLDV